MEISPVIQKIKVDEWAFHHGKWEQASKILKFVKELRKRDREEWEEVFDDPLAEDPDRFEEYMRSGRGIYVLVLKGEEPVGLGLLVRSEWRRVISEEGVRELEENAYESFVLVDRKYRRNGIGKRILEHLLEVAKQLKIQRIYFSPIGNSERVRGFLAERGVSEEEIERFQMGKKTQIDRGVIEELYRELENIYTPSHFLQFSITLSEKMGYRVKFLGFNPEDGSPVYVRVLEQV